MVLQRTSFPQSRSCFSLKIGKYWSKNLVRAYGHGEHTDEVLGELGIASDRLIEFKISGAVL